MAIATRLIGKLGGSGGRVETAQQTINGVAYRSIPSGWKKAVGVFDSTKPAANNVTLFRQNFRGVQGLYLNGGGYSPAKTTSTTTGSRGLSPGTGWNNPHGGDLNDHHHNPHREDRRPARSQDRASQRQNTGCDRHRARWVGQRISNLLRQPHGHRPGRLQQILPWHGVTNSVLRGGSLYRQNVQLQPGQRHGEHGQNCLTPVVVM